MKKIILFLCLVSLHSLNSAFHEIHKAALRGRTDKVRSLIGKGVDVNLRDQKGWTPLHYAAAAGNDATVNLLLDKRADIDVRDNNRQTPLHKASEWGRANVVQTLIERGAEVGAQDNKGKTPLHVVHGVQVAQELLKRGVDVNAQDYMERTPLHSAAFDGNESVVKALVQAGADMRMQDMKGKTPRDLVVMQSKDVRVRKRIEQYLKKKEKLAGKLHAAVKDGNLVQTKKLIAAGAPINAPDNQGNRVLHLAVLNEYPKIVKYLLDDKKINVRLANHDGKIALEQAAGESEILDIFKKKFKQVSI